MKRFLSGIMAVVLILCIVCAGCTNAPNNSQNATTNNKIVISGAFALYPMMITWSEEYKKIHPGVEFEISAGGAGKGMTDALTGMVDIGMVSRDIHPEETAQGIFALGVARDAVVGTVNANNPYASQIVEKGVTKSAITGAYINGTVLTWGDLLADPSLSSRINLYTRSDACGAADVWSAYMGGYHQEDLLGTGVYGDPGLAEAVRTDPLGMGYNNVNYAYDPTTGLPVSGIQVMPLDLNENGVIDQDENFYATRDELVTAIQDGRYPSPPSRILYIVTKDKFTGPSRDFVQWILTDGQAYVLENGYVPLSNESLVEELQQL